MNHMERQARFRRQLNAQIKRADIKRVTLGKLTGANVGQVNRWTEGSLMPTYHQFQRLLEIFDIEDEYLVGTSVSEKSYNQMFKASL